MDSSVPRPARRVVVTGIGPVTAIGTGKTAFWEGLLRERSAIKRLPPPESASSCPLRDSPQFHAKHAAWIEDFDPGQWFPPHRLKRLDRYVQFSLAATRLAIEDAGLNFSPGNPSARTGVSFGTGIGGIAHAEHQHRLFLERGIHGVTPALAFQIWGGSAHANIAIEFGLQGPCSTNSNTCASGQVAVIDAARCILDGQADVMIAGGAECPLAPLTFAAFDHIHTMSRWQGEPPERACRAFHRERDGFVMGEGAAAMVLEDLEHASIRGARIYGEVTGWSLTNEAHHMTTPRPDGIPLMAAVRLALERARVAPADIGYINTHGSATPANDVHECLKLAEVFGPAIRNIPLSATKAYTGHTLGAAGAIEAATCLLAMHHGWAPPTLNLDDPDPALAGFDLTPIHGRKAKINHVLSNSFGFGGVDSCLVLSRV